MTDAVFCPAGRRPAATAFAPQALSQGPAPMKTASDECAYPSTAIKRRPSGDAALTRQPSWQREHQSQILSIKAVPWPYPAIQNGMALRQDGLLQKFKTDFTLGLSTRIGLPRGFAMDGFIGLLPAAVAPGHVIMNGCLRNTTRKKSLRIGSAVGQIDGNQFLGGNY